MNKSLTAILIAAGALLAPPADAATFCIDTPAGLRSALQTSVGNGADDEIRLVRGTYSGSFDLTDAFTFEARSVTLEGGYSAGCASRDPDPANTVIQSPGGKVLGLSACVLLSGCEIGDFNIDALTLRGGVDREGAAITVFTAGTVTISNSILTGNQATEVDGGAVNVAFPLFSDVGPQSLVIRNSEISENQAARDGGGVWVGFGKSVTITDSRITGNTAQEGGGLSMGAPCVQIAGNVIDGNIALGGDGGGLVGISLGECGLPAGEAWSVSGNRVTNNDADLQGGGMSLNAVANVAANLLEGNSAASGGGLWIAGPARVVNNLIVDNTGENGAGAGLLDSVEFINNTVYGNAGTQVGGVSARMRFTGFTLSLINNIIVGNSGPIADLQVVDEATSTANVFNNDFDGNSAMIDASILNAEDNLDAVDPRFVNAAVGDYRLEANSPLVDAGLDVVNLPQTDFFGNDRVSGAAVDIGAYEVQLGATTTTTGSTTTTLPAGICGDPLSDPSAIDGFAARASLITATDALLVLGASVGLQTCKNCICDVNDSGSVTSTDALIVLQVVVGLDVSLDCPPCT